MPWTLPTGVNVTTGQLYTLALTFDDSQDYLEWPISTTNPYAGGRSNVWPTTDWVFATYVLGPNSQLGATFIDGTLKLDALAGAGTRVVVVDSAGRLKGDVPTSALGDNLGNHQATQNIGLNDHELRLRSPTDAYHGLAWGGNSWNVDGPALYGYSGGVLGTNQNGFRKSALYWNSAGNVGIGGYPGNYRLHVRGGDSRIADFGGEQALFGLDKLVGYNDLRFYTDDAGTTERMRLSQTGNLGIGPGGFNASERLEVEGNVRINGTANVLELGGGVSGKDVSAGKIGYQQFSPFNALDIVGAGTNNTNRRIKLWGEGGVEINGQIQNTAGGIRFPDNTVQTTAAVPTPGDNLGNHTATQNLNLGTNSLVGTSAVNVNSPLNLNEKDLLLRATNATDLNHGLGFYGGSKLWNGINLDGPVLYGNSGGILGTNAGGTRNSALYWNTSGNVGVGVAADATNRLTVDGRLLLRGNGADRAVLWHDTGYDRLTLETIGSTRFSVATGGAERLVVLTGGNVGIGTNNPSQPLEVAGQIYTSSGGIRFPDNTVQTTAAAAPTATNGLSVPSGSVALGGSLTQSLTTIGQGTNDLRFTANDPSGTQTVVDQQYLVASNSGAFVASGLWQSFTAGVTGSLKAVAFQGNVFSFGATATITIYSGTGTGGTVLGTATMSYGGVPSGLQWATLPTPVAVTVGQPYTMAVTSASDYAWLTAFANGYAGGTSSLGGYDMGFATSVLGTNLLALNGSSGNVGIGTGSPTQKLEVAGQIYSSSGGIRFPDNTVQTTAAAGDNLGNHTATQNLSLGTFKLTGNGGTQGLGIGSDGVLNPDNGLSLIDKDIYFRGANGSDPNQGVGWYGPGKLWNGVSPDGPVLYGYDSGILGTNRNGTRNSALSWNSSSQVGLNTTSPNATLDIAGGADNTGANDPRALAFQLRTGGYRHFVRSRHNATVSNTGNDLDFYLNSSSTPAGSSAAGTGNTHVLTLEANNAQPRVGIGTTAPTTTLDVAGTTRTTSLQVTGGSPAAGRVLTSDAAGNATWQAPAAVGLTNVSAPLTGNGVSTPLSILPVTAGQSGYLTSADWTTFSNKLGTASNGLTKTGTDVALGGTLTGATTIATTAANGLTINGAGAVSVGTGTGTTAVGNATGATTIAGNGIGLTGATTITGATGINTSGSATTNLGTGASAGAVSIGRAGGTVTIGNLTGAGTRVVTVDPSGNLATATGTTGEATTASNGLTLSGNDVQLGGALTGATTIASGGNAFSLTGYGNVGIGTSSPTAALQVATQQVGTATLDQQQATFSGFGAGSNVAFSQGFVAGLSGRLTRVDVRHTGGGLPGSVTMTIAASTASSCPTGPTLATATFTPVSNTVTQVTFATPATLTAGSMYTITLSTGFGWSYVVANPYTAGSGCSDPSVDFYFATYVVPVALNANVLVVTGSTVGVNTASPAATLDVNGTTRTTSLQVTSGAAASRVLTSDASGNATWQAPAAVGLTNVSAPLTGNGVSTALSIPAATSSQNGYLTSTDWTTFNGKGTFTLPSLTSGSVVFSNGTTLAQDNANFYWDDTNNRLGIGSTGPASKLDVAGGVAVDAGDTFAGTFTSAGNALRFGSSGSGEGIGSKRTSGGNFGGLDFYSNFTSRLSISNAGAVSIGGATSISGNLTGTTAAFSSSLGTLATFTSTAADPNGVIVVQVPDVAGCAGCSELMIFRKASGQIGSITMNAAATGVTYNTTSDKRLKENVTPTHYGLRDLMRIEVKDYNFVGQAAATREVGFLAQDLFHIYPDAVKQGDHGLTVTNQWAVDYGKLTPLLVQAIQDQQHEIEDLRAANALLQQQATQSAADHAALLTLQEQVARLLGEAVPAALQAHK